MVLFDYGFLGLNITYGALNCFFHSMALNLFHVSYSPHLWLMFPLKANACEEGMDVLQTSLDLAGEVF